MTTSKNHLWLAGTAVLSLLVLIAAYFLVIAPKRAEAADLATQRLSTEQTNTEIAQQTALLKSQFATLDEQKAQLADIRATLPQNAEVPQLLRRLEGFATAAGVSLTGITPGEPQVHVATAAVAPTAGATAVATPSTATTLIDIPLTVTTTGSFVSSELFIKNLQADMQRYFLLQNLSLNAGDGTAASSVTMTLTGTIFVLRDATTTAASAAAPTASTETAS